MDGGRLSAHFGSIDSQTLSDFAGPECPAHQMELNMTLSLKTSAAAVMIFAGLSFAAYAGTADFKSAGTETSVQDPGKGHHKLRLKLFGANASAVTGSDVSESDAGTDVSGTDSASEDNSGTEMETDDNSSDNSDEGSSDGSSDTSGSDSESD